MNDKGTTDEGAAMFTGGEAPPRALLTPLDIQNKEFRVSRMGGYRMRDVDEFLDEVTETLSAVIAENEALRAGATEAATAPGAPSTAGDGEVLRPFLVQERDFLRSLGSLVQDHAERVKAMARIARSAPGVSAPDDATGDDTPAEDRSIPRAPEPSEQQATAVVTSDQPTSEAEDTIRLDESQRPEPEPEPVVARRPDEARSEPSLRELFWGEEG